jgi:hypothetical protein
MMVSVYRCISLIKVNIINEKVNSTVRCELAEALRAAFAYSLQLVAYCCIRTLQS